MSWVAVAIGGSALIGAGVSMYGANKQAKANSGAQDANAQLQREQNDAAWANWLMTRGVMPKTQVPAGTMPAAGNSSVVNTRMPLWASMNVASGPSKWRKRGKQAAPGTLAVVLPAGDETTYATGSGTAASGEGSTSGKGQRLANLLDPLNVTIGKNKNPLDPLGLFG